jgi:hypothetical protein
MTAAGYCLNEVISFHHLQRDSFTLQPNAMTPDRIIDQPPAIHLSPVIPISEQVRTRARPFTASPGRPFSLFRRPAIGSRRTRQGIVLVAYCLFGALAAAQPGLVGSRTVAPGVVHKEFTLPGPNTLDVLEVTVDNPLISLESYRPDGLTRTTTQAAANDRIGHRVIGAVNADFFSFETGWPVGNQVVNGVFALGVNSQRSHLALDSSGRPFIDRLAFRGSLLTASGATQSLTGVNVDRAAGACVVYNTFRGPSTGTDGAGVECTVQFLNISQTAGDTLLARVTSRVNGGNTSIPPGNTGVLSAAPGTPSTFLTGNVQVGDTVRIVLGFNRPLRHILLALGGAGRILLGGRNVTDSMAAFEGISASFTDARHPRTFVGINKDTSKIFLCTVDGRQASSIGMTFDEMAGFLLSIGASEAFNFDGGGSTTMVVRNAIVNSPSDPGGERSVANSLQVISRAPTGTLANLAIRPRRADVFQGGTFQFSATGTDEYSNPIPLPPDVAWETSPALGTISPAGLFDALTTNDSGWVRIRWNAVVDSAFVIVRTLRRLHVTPSPLVMTPGEQVTMLVRAEDNAGRRVSLNNMLVSFTSSSAALNVDGTGLVTAKDFGSGTVTVRLDTLSAGIPFNLSGNDTSIVIDRMLSLFPWETSLVNCDTSRVHTRLASDPAVPDPPALRVDYSLADSRPALLLNTLTPLAGRIDSLAVRVYGAGNGDTIRFMVRDRDGDSFVLTPAAAVTWLNEWRTIGVMMSRAVPLGAAALDYPVTITQIRIDFGRGNLSGGTINGVLFLDDLGAHYPVRTVAPQLLFDFESGISGWLTPSQSNTAQLKGINIAASSLVQTAEQAYQGTYAGKWTLVDDAGSSVDWDVRITRGQNADLGLMLRGSYVGAWVYANGETNTELQIVVRDGNGQICAGPQFPVHHYGWKLIGTRLDEGLFSPYLTAGRITDAGNKFNGFRVRGLNAVLSGATRTVILDKLVTSALTVPTGFTGFTVEWNNPLVRLHWTVNSEISINRYAIERNTGGGFVEIGSMQGRGNIDTTVHYESVDTPSPAGVISYRIRQITNDGGQELSQVVQVNTGTNAVGPEGMLPEEFQLYQNYPNPFNPSTAFRYALPVDSFVRLTVHNTLGQRIEEVVNSRNTAGVYEVLWSPRLASGIYYVTIHATPAAGADAPYTATKALVLLK